MLEEGNQQEQITFICVDDGSGKQVYYVTADRKIKTRNRPEGFIDEYLDCGERKFYFKGSCIRCQRECSPALLSRNEQTEAFSFNLCEICLVATTPGIKSLRGNGDLVWASNESMPKICYVNLKERSFSETREADVLTRSKLARYSTLYALKMRRNVYRQNIISVRAKDFNVINGSVASWGFDLDKFDEYFGEVDERTDLPNGLGVKFYSDGSVYVGGWKNGVQHTDEQNGGQFISTIGSTYEGTWMFGVKHGKGVQKYPDGSVYIGEFAKGLEHGQGKREYPDGTAFEGRYRFGKKDGPGQLMRNGAVIEKAIYRDKEVFYDKYPPAVKELTKTGDIPPSTTPESIEYHNADSLLQIAFRAVAKHLETCPDRLTPSMVARRLPRHLKHRLSIQYLRNMKVIGSEEFLKFLQNNDIAFNEHKDEMIISGVPMFPQDVEALSIFQGANKNLKLLRIASSRLKASAVDVVAHKLADGLWPSLHTVDLSFNKMELNAIKFICDGVLAAPYLRSLKLSGCGIKPNGAPILASFLIEDDHLEELDLSFNAVGASGTEALIVALSKNTTLKGLNLRQNNLGIVGGEALVRCFTSGANTTLKMLCLADNKIGVDNFALIAATVRSSVGNIVRSCRGHELELPERYDPSRDPLIKIYK